MILRIELWGLKSNMDKDRTLLFILAISLTFFIGIVMVVLLYRQNGRENVIKERCTQRGGIYQEFRGYDPLCFNPSAIIPINGDNN